MKGSAVNVLIVDDNQAAADLLQELLQLEGHSARCTYSGYEALMAFATEAFDLALIDLTLPDLPGTEVARRLRASTSGLQLTVVAISGFSASDAPGIKEPGLFDHFLQKPIDFDALDRILAAAQGGR